MFQAIPPAAPLLGVAAVNRAIVTLISAGSAAGLFPVITPVTPGLNGAAGPRTDPENISDLPQPASSSATPSPDPDAVPRTADGELGHAAYAVPRSPETPVLTAGLVALGLAMMLVMTRLSVRRRAGRRGRRG